MQKTVLRIFLFALGNVLLLLLHFRLFNMQPVFGFVTAAVHIILLILFPYSRFFKTHR
jgi:hypothetical protein